MLNLNSDPSDRIMVRGEEEICAMAKLISWLIRV